MQSLIQRRWKSLETTFTDSTIIRKLEVDGKKKRRIDPFPISRRMQKNKIKIKIKSKRETMRYHVVDRKKKRVHSQRPEPHPKTPYPMFVPNEVNAADMQEGNGMHFSQSTDNACISIPAPVPRNTSIPFKNRRGYFCSLVIFDVTVSCQNMTLEFLWIFVPELRGLTVQGARAVAYVVSTLLSAISLIIRNTYLFGSPSKLCKLSSTL